MSMDASLKSASSLVRHRNVLTRAERVERMKSEEKWGDRKTVLGLPKLSNRKLALGKPKKEAKEGDEATPAKGGKAAAPAAGAKKK